MTYHSVIIQGLRFKMAEGAIQSTNVQLVLDKLDDEQTAKVLQDAKRMRPAYSKKPVHAMLLNLIIIGASKRL